MMHVLGVRIQIGLVIALFLGSLSALLLSGIQAAGLPRREAEVRARLREASRRMAEGAADFTDSLPHNPGSLPESINEKLRDLTRRVLLDYAGVEGGFYFVAADRFGGYAHPSGEPRSVEDAQRNEPPPLEAHIIRGQARQCTDLKPGDFIISVQKVGPSRVAILTEPVSDTRPAPLVTWVMYRLTNPEQLEDDLRRFGIASALALGGIALALGLTWNLGRTLTRQRREQEQLRDELRRAEHLASLGKLLAAVAHEVRNPLAGIRSTVQLWQRLPESALTPQSMEAVVAAVDRLNALVSRLLLFSRADSAERGPVDVNKVFGEGLDLVAAQATEQGVALERDFAAGLPAVIGSVNALRQVALNLLTNALQAMRGGGQLRCSSRREGNRIAVGVSDTGRGIAEGDRQRLFEPFFTTRADGTGLGLALCREVIEGHGGRIELEATGPTGTTFSVYLPVGANS